LVAKADRSEIINRKWYYALSVPPIWRSCRSARTIPGFIRTALRNIVVLTIPIVAPFVPAIHSVRPCSPESVQRY
jgi:hypothetical protein